MGTQDCLSERAREGFPQVLSEGGGASSCVCFTLLVFVKLVRIRWLLIWSGAISQQKMNP